MLEGPNGQLETPEWLHPTAWVTLQPAKPVLVGADVVVVGETDYVDFAVRLDVVQYLVNSRKSIAIAGVYVKDCLAQRGS
jgi:hypothetical protein